ncbi:uncharacterized protein CIMG_07927 [Coccidioides immitis RS]|uniref:Uncharacterized protein n=2 Tax=Coccidioides immitis TaxID=5501 RepID=J3K4F3_COCIM|nr:uncharacterized protein CIMG_07927 [Coccidioides immitis RS]EAS29181.3 hypothetical protein CIMG_07927 [Coccidioides immitis RS]KMU80497.1 hypothetical protein CISG_02348 [Coccidioides immitis RMSCC 3703]
MVFSEGKLTCERAVMSASRTWVQKGNLRMKYQSAQDARCSVSNPDQVIHPSQVPTPGIVETPFCARRFCIAMETGNRARTPYCPRNGQARKRPPTSPHLSGHGSPRSHR